MPDTRKGRILVMDDEPALTKLINLFLTRHGYQVITFVKGSEAWAEFEANGTEYDLVIADLHMPDFDVQPYFPKFVQRHNKVQVLICSGQPFDTQGLPKSVRGHFSFLQKPFVPTMLVNAVEQALSRVQYLQPAV